MAIEAETNTNRDRNGPPLEPQQTPIEAATDANCDRNRPSLEPQQMPIEAATDTNCDRNNPPWEPQQDHIAAATGRPLRPQQAPIVTATGPHYSRNRTPIEATTTTPEPSKGTLCGHSARHCAHDAFKMTANINDFRCSLETVKIERASENTPCCHHRQI